MRQYFRDVREGGRILRSREFWISFREYWSPAAIAGRMEAFAERLEEASGRRR